MFIYNIKLNSKNIVKIAFAVISIIITIFFIISIYKIITETIRVRDEVQMPDVTYIESKNYANILKEVYDDLDTYVGQTICFTGYVYRNSDFDDDYFVLARDMQTNQENKTLIIGFLCNCKDSKKYKDGTWIEITGTIEKGNYHGEIPVLNIIAIKEIAEPKEKAVPLPDDTYVPTAVIF